jgi:hypothetical protein
MGASVHYRIAKGIKIAVKIPVPVSVGGPSAIIERRSLGSVIVRLAGNETDLSQTDCKRFVIVRRQICISDRRASAIGNEGHLFRQQQFDFL